MARNLGKIRLELTEIEGRPYGIPYAVDSDLLWRDHAPETPGCIWIVVMDDGTIWGSGPDPAWHLIEGMDVWEVEGQDWQNAPGKHWNGEAIT